MKRMCVLVCAVQAAARTATSDADGTVVFSGTAPGTYTVTASHDGWRFAPSSAKVEVTWGSAQAAQALTIAGRHSLCPRGGAPDLFPPSRMPVTCLFHQPLMLLVLLQPVVPVLVSALLSGWLRLARYRSVQHMLPRTRTHAPPLPLLLQLVHVCVCHQAARSSAL